MQGEVGVLLAAHYDILQPANIDAKRDQNCLVLCRKRFLKDATTVVEITHDVLKLANATNPAKRSGLRPVFALRRRNTRARNNFQLSFAVTAH